MLYLLYMGFDRSRPRGGNFRGRGGFNDRGGGNGGGFDNLRSFDRPQMHQATCDKCQKECEVPFRPTSGKPVFCSSCFENQRPDSRRSEGRNFDNRYNNPGPNTEAANPQYEEQFALLSSKLDKILQILTPIAAEVEAEENVEEAAEQTPEESES